MRRLKAIGALVAVGLLAAACSAGKGGGNSNGNGSTKATNTVTISNENGALWTCNFSPFNGSDTLLSVFPLRINEYMSVCNVEAIAQSFNVEQCYSGNPDAALWVDFGRRSDSNDGRPYSLKTTLVTRSETLHVGSGRPIDVLSE